MKKLAILFGFLALTSQMPFCPYQVLPSDMVSSLEYGRKWTGMFLQAYGITDAQPVAESKKPANESAILMAEAHSTAPVPPTEPCPLSVEFPVPAEFPVAAVKSVEMSMVEPVVSIHIDDAKLNEEFRQEIQKATEELRKALNNKEFQEMIITSQVHEMRARAAERRAKVRIMGIARSV